VIECNISVAGQEVAGQGRSALSILFHIRNRLESKIWSGIFSILYQPTRFTA